MIISERQIAQLIHFVNGYIACLAQMKIAGIEMSNNNEIRHDAAELLVNIANQQRRELKVIE